MTDLLPRLKEGEGADRKQTWDEIQAEAEIAKIKLGIGRPLPERIDKLIHNNFQYASRGDTAALIFEIERLRALITAKEASHD